MSRAPASAPGHAEPSFLAAAATRRALACFLLIAAILILDQWTKAWVLNEPRFNALGCLDGLERCGRIEVSGVFDFTMLWNRGISYGLLQSYGMLRWVMVAVTLAISVFFFLWMLRARTRLSAFALALVVGGAVGNLVDRIRFGAVVDFLDFSSIGFAYVFNVADTAVTVGAILLFADLFLFNRETKTETSP